MHVLVMGNGLETKVSRFFFFLIFLHLDIIKEDEHSQFKLESGFFEIKLLGELLDPALSRVV